MENEKCSCKCGNNPYDHGNMFMIILEEYGYMDRLYRCEEVATCKTCLEEFKREWK
mgnify:CR=1 FL=1